MGKSRLDQFVNKLIRFKRVGAKKWRFGYCTSLHLKNPEDVLMLKSLDLFGEPSGNMKQLRVYEENGVVQVVKVVICEHQRE